MKSLEEGLNLQPFAEEALVPLNSFALREGEWRKGEDTVAWDVSAAAVVTNSFLIMFHLLLT